jgi:hypothetical protein
MNGLLRLIKYMPTKEVKESITSSVLPNLTKKVTTNYNYLTKKVTTNYNHPIKKVTTSYNCPTNNCPKSKTRNEIIRNVRSSNTIYAPVFAVSTNAISPSLSYIVPDSIRSNTIYKSIASVSSITTEKNQNDTPEPLGSSKEKHNVHPNMIPQASIFFARVKTTTGIAVTALIGLGYGETYWLIILLISESRKFKSAMYQIAIAATFCHVLNLFFYTVVIDYQLSPYLMGDQGIGAWALLCGVISNIINILIYWFIILRLYTFMKVKIILTSSYKGAF